VLFKFSGFSSGKNEERIKSRQRITKTKEIEALIDSKNFVFEAQKASPQGGRMLNLDYNTYFLKFNAEKTTCDLPFFGRAFNVAYGGDGGIKFEGVPENIQIEKRKNRLMSKQLSKVRMMFIRFISIFSLMEEQRFLLIVITEHRFHMMEKLKLQKRMQIKNRRAF
jgi:hypothetical protein